MRKRELFAIASLCMMIGCAADPRDVTPAEDQVDVVEQDIGGGGAPPGCADKSFCYCQCRVQHQCFLNPSECGPLGSCLTACDHQYPVACPDNGPQFPRRIQDCF